MSIVLQLIAGSFILPEEVHLTSSGVLLIYGVHHLKSRTPYLLQSVNELHGSAVHYLGDLQTIIP